MAADYQFCDPLIGAAGPATATHSAPQWPLGMQANAMDRNFSTASGGGAAVFQYVRGSNGASKGEFGHIVNGSFVQLASANSASNFPIGVAAAVLSATNVYGWAQVYGRADYCRGSNTGLTQGIPHYLGATAGLVFSNTVAGNRIQGLAVPYTQTATASSAGSYVFDLNHPFVAGVTASL